MQKEKRNAVLFNDEELEKLTVQYDALLDEVMKRRRSFRNSERKRLKRLRKMSGISLRFLICPKLSLLFILKREIFLQTALIKLNF